MITAFQTMLGRDPESDEVIKSYQEIGIEGTLRTIVGSSKFEAQRNGSPSFYYNQVRRTLAHRPSRAS